MTFELDIVTRARVFAVGAHGAQRYGKEPYVAHLDAVYMVLVRYGHNEEHLHAAAYLHDVIEDTPVDAGLVEEHFGSVITKLVLAVTNEPGRNRVERHRLTYPKIRAAGEEATALKLADRIANVEQSLKTSVKLLMMYRHEHAAFKQALHVEGEHEAMWAHLDDMLE